MQPHPHTPPKSKDMQWIYFFKTHNYAWIEEKHIQPFEPYREKHKASGKPAGWKLALKELEDIIGMLNLDFNMFILNLPLVSHT